jgi:multidrug efflux pump subunit AcrB
VSARAGLFAGLVARPVALSVVFVALLVVGLIAYDRIPLQMMPDGFVEPGLQVWVAHPGSSAQENEEKVARVLEGELRTLSRIEEIESTSNDESVWISIQFEADTDMDLAKAEVRDRIERGRSELPATVRDIGIWSWSNDEMPVMFFAMLHPGESRRTDFLIDEVIQRRLQALDGVGRVEIFGVLDDSMRILLDEQRVRAARVDLGRLIGRLSSDNFALPMGEVTDGGRLVLLRSDMRFTSPEEIAAYPVGDGLVIGDLGRVEAVKSVRNRLFRIDGSYAYYGEVQKDSQANVVATCERVRAAFEELERDPRLGGEFKFLPLFDQGEFIETSLGQLRSTALWGGGLAVGVLFVFLWRVRLTLCVALSIPVSVLLAIAWLYFGGGTFNVLTMTGITLAMGMLVDNSVVVIENVSRLAAQGRSSREAAAVGTREVALAVLLATLTTVVVFLPLIFMSQNPMLRILFGELGLPLCLALVFSLLVALVFLPVVAARLVGPRPARVERLARRLARIGALPARGVALAAGAIAAAGFGLLRAVHGLSRLALGVLAPLRWPLAALVAALAGWSAWSAWSAERLSARLPQFGARAAWPPGGALALSVLAALAALFVLLHLVPAWNKRRADPPRRPRSFVPQGDSIIGLVIGANRALVGWTLQHRLLASTLAALAFASVFWPQSHMTMTAFGQDENTSRLSLQVELEDNFTLEQAEQEMLRYEEFFEARRERWGFAHLATRFDEREGRLSVYWEGRRSRADLEANQREVREELPSFPGHRARLRDEEAGGSRNRSLVTFRLQGPDSEELERYGERAVELLEGVRGLSGVSSPLEDSPGQVRVVFDSDLAQSFGISPEGALQSIAWALRGWQLPRYQEEGREVPLLIEYDDEEVEGLSTLRDLEISSRESPVPLASFAELEFGHGSRSIHRRNGQTSFTIQARVDDPLRQKEMSEEGYRALAALELPRGYSIGEEDLIGIRQEEELGELRSALLLSVVLVFLLMGILFESFLLPVSVLATIPFAVVGALWTLYLTGTTMDSVGWIGIIILVGVVVNNGIVLIDRIHSLRAAGPDGPGLERSAAVVEGCGNRVRPVLMTALTTVIGLLPMALSEPSGEGIDYRALATCVAGGLTASTFFTLWVVPLAYTLLDDLSTALHARTRWALRPANLASATSES